MSHTTSPRFGVDADLPDFVPNALSCFDFVVAILVRDLLDKRFERDRRFSRYDDELAGSDRQIDGGVLFQVDLFRERPRDPHCQAVSPLLDRSFHGKPRRYNEYTRQNQTAAARSSISGVRFHTCNSQASPSRQPRISRDSTTRTPGASLRAASTSVRATAAACTGFMLGGMSQAREAAIRSPRRGSGRGPGGGGAGRGQGGGDPFAAAVFGAVAEEEGGAEDGQGSVAEGAEVGFHFALDAVVE